MEVTRSSESSVHIRTTWRYIPGNENIYNYRFENVKSYILELCAKHWLNIHTYRNGNLKNFIFTVAVLSK
jgi:hypothetical protein